MALGRELRLDARHHIKMLSLFATALVPAWVILLIRYAFSADANLEIALLLVPLIAAVPAVVIRYLQRAALANTDLVHIHVKKKSDITGEVALYTLAYIPVVLFEDFAPANLLTLLTIMVVIYAMYVRFNLLHVNPVISLFYRNLPRGRQPRQHRRSGCQAQGSSRIFVTMPRALGWPLHGHGRRPLAAPFCHNLALSYRYVPVAGVYYGLL